MAHVGRYDGYAEHIGATQRNFERKRLQKVKKVEGGDVSAKARVDERVTWLEDTIYALQQQIREIYEFWEAQSITTALRSEDALSCNDGVGRPEDNQREAPLSGESVSEKVCNRVFCLRDCETNDVNETPRLQGVVCRWRWTQVWPSATTR